MKKIFKKIIKSPWFWAVVSLLAVRGAMLFFALHGMPDLGADKSSWVTRFGGDEFNYFESAVALLSWDFVPGAFPIGFSLFLVPFVWGFGADSMIDIVKPIILLQSVIFYTIASVLVYILAKQFLIKRIKALAVTLIFTIYPYLFYAFFHFFAQGSVIESFKISRFAQLMFFLALSDPLAMILMISSLLIIFQKLSSFCIR